MHQLWVCIYFLPLEPPPHFLPPHSSRSSQSTTLSSLCYRHSSFPLAMSFTRGSVYMSILPFQFIPPSPSPSVSTNLFFICLYSCPANRFISTIFLDSIYTLMYNICFSLSDILQTVWQTLGSSASLQMTQFYTFFSYLFIFYSYLFWYDTGTSSNGRPEACELLLFIY